LNGRSDLAYVLEQSYAIENQAIEFSPEAIGRVAGKALSRCLKVCAHGLVSDAHKCNAVCCGQVEASAEVNDGANDVRLSYFRAFSGRGLASKIEPALGITLPEVDP
jgi:hypothetical protein